MSDPRNLAHAKKVSQEKKHHGTEPTVPAEETPSADAAVPPAVTPPAALTGSLIVLTKLKELEFHSRAHLERLAELSMTVEDELKQTPMVGAFGEVYAAQSVLQTKLTSLLESYKAECDRLQPEG